MNTRGALIITQGSFKGSFYKDYQTHNKNGLWRPNSIRAVYVEILGNVPLSGQRTHLGFGWSLCRLGYGKVDYQVLGPVNPQGVEIM